MAKFYGVVGFAETKEIEPGKNVEQLTEYNYQGDVLNESSMRQAGEYQIDDLNVANRLSIVADPYANEHFSKIRYVHWMGADWKVSKVQVQYPRLILTIGGVYNGKKAQVARPVPDPNP